MTLRIRELRKAAKLTQDQLAAKAGISRSQLSEIESGVKPANTKRLFDIAKALGVNVDILFVDKDGQAIAIEIKQIASSLSEENQRTLLEVARALLRTDSAQTR